MGKLTKVDLEIANFYAPYLLDSVRLGESKICVWFPGAGKSTILRDIFDSKTILESHLKDLYKRLIIIFPTFSDLKLKDEMANTFGCTTDSQAIKNSVLKQISGGKELLVVLDKLEDLSEKEHMSTLKELAQIVNINPRRVHSIVNTFDAGFAEEFLSKYPDAFSIANKLDYLPVISDKLLDKYIENKSKLLDKKLSLSEKEQLKRYTGGILFLTKELIRSGETEHFDAKVRTIWMRLPKEIRELYLDLLISKGKIQNIRKLKLLNQLELHKVTDLIVFSKNIANLSENPLGQIRKILSHTEFQIYKNLTSSPKKQITRDEIAKTIWGKKWEEDYSDWAIDATMSRMRKKLAKVGIEPSVLKTIKGKGYKWEL